MTSLPASAGARNPDPLLLWALDYAGRGWPVFPVHVPVFGPDGVAVGCSCSKGPKCPEKDRGRHPRTAHGHKEATTDEATIRAWWTQWPGANIGIATGGAARLVILDADSLEAINALFALQTAHGPLPFTCAVETGRGAHFYLRAPEDTTIKSGAAVLGPGLDVRSEGGYVVAPPSFHASGKRYG